MKKIVMITAALTLMLGSALASAQSFKGTISDSMCKRKHMMPGKSDAQCIEECVKGGAHYVLLVGDKVYNLSAKKGQISPFAGKNVQIDGELKGDTITVAAIR